MPQQQPTPTFYDAFGKPVIKKAINYGINKGIGYGWQQYGKPAWDSIWGSKVAETAATQAAETGAGTGATVAAETAGEGALSGLGGTNAGSYLSAAAPVLTVISPLIMGYLQYQKGSGRNEPVQRRMETQGAGRLIDDTMSGKEQDPSRVWADYQLPMKWKEGKRPMDPDNGSMGTYDEKGNAESPFEPYTIPELWHDMHRRGKGHYQAGGTGNSGYTDADIDNMFGPNKEALAKELGMTELPDWTNQRYDDWFPKNSKVEEPVRYDMSGDTSIPVYQKDVDREMLGYIGNASGGGNPKEWSPEDKILYQIMQAKKENQNG